MSFERLSSFGLSIFGLDSPPPVTPRVVGWGLATAAAIAGLVALGEASLHLQREAALEAQRERARSLAAAIDDQAARTIAEVDLLLRRIARARAEGSDGPALGALLRRELDGTSLYNATVTDAAGMVIASTGGPATIATGASLAQRAHVAVHLRGDAGGLVLSPPLLGLTDRLWTIYLTRRIEDGNGRLLGVASIGLPPHRLIDFYKSLALRPGEAAAVVGSDGIVRARLLGSDDSIGQELADHPALQAPEPAGDRLALIDGREHLLAWRRLGGAPLVALLDMDVAEALAPLAGSRALQRVLVVLAALLALAVGTQRVRSALRSAEQLRYPRERRLLRAMLAGSPLMIVLRDLDGSIVVANPAWRAAGFVDEEQERSVVAQVAYGQQALTRQLTTGQGEDARAVQLVSYPLFDREGRIEAVGTVGLDVTEHHRIARRLAEREHELLLITNHLGPVARLDGELRFEHANNVFVRAFARADVSLLGGRFAAEVLEDEAFALMRSPLRAAAGGQRADFEMRVERLGRGARQYLVSALPDPAADAAGRHGISLLGFDITERKRSEDAILRLNAELEGRVAQRTAELRSANEQLSESIESLRRAQAQLVQQEKLASLGGLVAGVAHEINTPVGIVVTAASHLEMQLAALRRRLDANELRRGDLQSFLDDAGESMAIVLANLDRASELVRSFKLVAVDQTSDQRRPFQLRAYLDEVLRNLSPQLQRTRHRVEISCDPHLVIDSHPGAFSQIVTNLVMNSLQHGFEGIEAGTIRIEVHEDEEGLRLDYADDGRGIAAEHLPHLFDPFFTTRRGQGGSGLGLHIVFNLVTQRLGGGIVCSSPPGGGARFTIRLPRHSRAREPVAGMAG